MSATPLRDPDAPQPANAPTLLWSDARLLGFKPMDEIHEEFYTVTLDLLACTDETADAALQRFLTHAKHHFAEEDQWMESTAFPPRDCHIQEHAAVLKSANEVREAIASGKAGAELAQDFGTYLFQWFPGHADYLDSALAAWMSKRQYGGQPVVLRRRVTTP